MSDDWRVRLTFGDDSEAARRAEQLRATELGRDVARRLGDRIAVSQDGAELFLYANTEDAARSAYQVVQSQVQGDRFGASAELARWHDEEERWERADRPLPTSEAEHRAEHARLLEAEDEDTESQGYADWEVRAVLPSRGDARELAHRLEREGVPHMRRWRSIFIGAEDEDAARAWEARLRAEAPTGTEFHVEGTFASVERHNPFAAISGGAGGI